ncbi:lanthionine synthetase LanC family protein [Sphingosinicella sp. BN140058]|uniref:lanthionine synthetase LanC family protein n=1 Tax=Sphingosinicella sp. BN140058 TaxID=1892855 RepID=UPI0010117D42|nr:lanthionine synthetase LanC family protein [Sphingosinicella sp. BN140058]QAY78210.1 hypothetical protein ETR14_17990 [Sphingosinicella sp. BN140058]
MPADADIRREAALDIGHALCAEALWWDGRCTFTTDDIDSTASGWRTVHRSCGGDLYTGSAGIGLFLARLSAVTGDRVIGRTAIGALTHALLEAGAPDMHRTNGLFVGRVGIALAATQAGQWLGREALLEQARTLALDLASDGCRGFAGSDLMAGLGGGVAGALALARRLDEESLIDWASTLGDALIDRAERTGAGWHWPNRKEPIGLCGLSHGAAGIAWALAELAHATGESRFAEAAAGAITHEQAWFDPKVGNWPDLSPESCDASGRRGFTMSWCHGAPGIALSRIRLWVLTGNAGLRAQAVAAVVTTAERLRSALEAGSGNYSLCHGLAGNAEALIAGSGLIETRDLVETIAMLGIDRFGDDPRSWPAGVDSGSATSPTLMLGLAGTGHFLLRVDDLATPSILLPDCEFGAVSEASEGLADAFRRFTPDTRPEAASADPLPV